MKVKLKKKKSLSCSSSHQGLKYEDWLSLNNGKSVEVDSIPSLLKDSVEVVKSKGVK